jgi:L-ascorbate metabolism protein UlaG (beta-lactamase superfamily)
MKARRLSWAGVELSHEGQRVLIDPFVEPDDMLRFVLAEDAEFLEPEGEEPVVAVLLTHLHRDHADVGVIERQLAPGGRVLLPRQPEPDDFAEMGTAAQRAALVAADLELVEVDPGWSGEAGPFTVGAVRASDATGDEQVSWIVAAGGKTVIHAGDTMWHGGWWKTAKAHGPIDVAFLPVNGAVINFPWTQPPASAAPAVLTPEQAVDATAALGAGRLVPIHYGDMHHDDFYRAHPDPEAAVAAAAAERGVAVAITPPGATVEL